MNGPLSRATNHLHQAGAHALSDQRGRNSGKSEIVTDNTDSAADGTIFSRLGDLLLANPIAIPILILAALIGMNIGWRRLTAVQNERGKPLRPLGAITRDTLRFALREDTRKLHPKIPLLTGRRTYLLLAAAGAASFAYPGYGLALAWPALAILLYARAAKVFRTRQQIIRQMYEVAHGECKYPKGAELAPWNRIAIQKWVNLVSPGTTVVTIPPAYQSEDLKTREKFERQFNGTISEDNSWTYKWESAKNRVVCTPASFLPTMALYPGPNPEWDNIDIGIKTDGTKATISLAQFPHTLVCGPTGSGKSVLQRMILFHCLSHPETWKIVGVDPKMVEMSWLRKYPNVLKIALSLEESVEVITQVRDEMKRRYEEMSELGVVHFQKLSNPPPALMLMVDETFNLLAPEGIRSDEGKERDAMHAQASALLGEIARLGRAAGVHMVLATQRPDATVIKGEMKNNLDCRIAAGRLDTTPSLMVLDSEAATRLPKIRGRGMVRLGGDMDTFQGFFAEQSWFDEQIEAARAEAAGESSEDEGKPSRGRRGRSAGSPGRVMGRLAERAASRAAALDAAALDAAALDAATSDDVVAPDGDEGLRTESAIDRPEVTDREMNNAEVPVVDVVPTMPAAEAEQSASASDGWDEDEDLDGWDEPGEWPGSSPMDESLAALMEEARLVGDDDPPVAPVTTDAREAATAPEVTSAAVSEGERRPGRIPTYFGAGGALARPGTTPVEPRTAGDPVLPLEALGPLSGANAGRAVEDEPTLLASGGGGSQAVVRGVDDVVSAPVVPAPVVPAPVMPAPLMPAPVVPAPVAPAPVVPAPVAPAPVMPAPVVVPMVAVPLASQEVADTPAEGQPGAPVRRLPTRPL